MRKIRMMRTTLACATATLLGGGVLACGARPHMTESHGMSYRSAFARQPVPVATKAPTGPEKGLDSQEAALISESYRRSLLPKTLKQQGTIQEEPIILVAPPTQGGARYGAQPLAPSVPKD